MTESLRKRSAGEEGFTLIELMVVVLIIGILIAIALPTFLGARERAQEKAAQSGLRNALTAAKTVFTDTDTYSGTGPGGTLIPADLEAVEPRLTFQVADSTGPTTISFQVDDVGSAPRAQWSGAALAATGRCFYLTVYESDATGSAGTYYGTGTAATCGGADAATNATAGSW